jgi:hypothetical protein
MYASVIEVCRSSYRVRDSVATKEAVYLFTNASEVDWCI